MTSANNTPENHFYQYDPFKFNQTAHSEPTTFTLEFLIKDIRYHYHIEFTKKEVVSEILQFYPHGRVTNLFIRRENDYEFGETLKGQKSVVKQLTAKNQLFLSKGAQNNIRQLVEVYNYFSEDFMTIPFLDSWTDTQYANRIAKELIRKNGNTSYIDNFKKLLTSFDTGISDFKVEKNELPFGNDYDINVDHILFDEKGQMKGSVSQSIEEESTGTQKLFVLGGLILRALMKGRVIMIDEFERSLHPLISSYILTLFNDPEINTQNAQLILATHDTNLLDKQNQLRRDQIWIIEKDQFASSQLFSLADIDGTRKGIPYEKWYLSGRFGGIPVVESLNFKLNFRDQ